MTPIRVETRGNFVAGAWSGPRGRAFEIRCPADTTHVVGTFYEHAADLDGALDAARAAQRRWGAAALETRIDVLRGFRDALAADGDVLARCITSEMGKTLADARGEVASVLTKFDITLALAPRELARIEVEGVDGYAELRPLGVFAVVGPFNFPVHLSNGHIVPALVAGNAVVLKPSSVAPACAELYVRAWERAAARVGAPAALLSLVQGTGAVGAALTADDRVDAVAFTGSYPVGVAIRTACAHQTGKLLALEMGGKNAAIVLPDADIERAADAIAGAACGLAGQRCTATSRVVVVAAAAEPLVAALRARFSAMTVGDPFEPTTALGPLATAAARDDFVAAQARLSGLETVLEGGAAAGPAPGHWVRPAIHRVTDAVAARDRLHTELFGPEVLVEAVATVDDAVARANDNPFGLAMSVHCASQDTFDALLPRLDTGLLNWNRGTAGASSALPFGGVKHSGNHRPTGSWSLRYCVRPVSVLRG